ncbi:ABC transporter ATP-binding protein [Candidatus Saccharibacteria bacterium]|nr:ABC transporter ATP-binding protein [Candidatus Saccharibacteria bacterium]NCU40342.1 ABC transporter ATP-binding protein [Candidatus Saccharibacteria bacterium]
MAKTKHKTQKVVRVADTVKLYWQQIRQYKISFFIMLIFIPISAVLLDTIVPYYLSRAIGSLAQAGSPELSQFIINATIAAMGGVILNIIGFQVMIRHESSVRKNLLHDTMQQLLAKDASFFANQKIGSLTSKFIDFMNGHAELQDLFIIRSLNLGIGIITGVILISFQAPVLSMIILGLLMFLILQIKISRNLRSHLRDQRKKLINEINGMSADTITNNFTVKTFAKERYEIKEIDKLSDKFKKAYRADFRWLSIESSSRIALMNIVQIVAILIIASMLAENVIELGIAIFALTYLQRLAGNLFVLGEILNGYDRIFLRTTPMAEILMEKPQLIDVPNAKKLSVTQGAIELQNITYAYADNKDSKVLQNLSLSIPPNNKVGLIGTSGAGKTTITKLLLRFDDVNDGKILIDEQDIAKVTQASLRENIAYVPQEPLLFHRSLRENIAYARPGATDQEVYEAAVKAYALEFIEALPQGLDTIVGERGVKLSGGQRQRVAIARAILKNAPILILDEATSALDSDSEKLIQYALAKLMQGRTSIVIAHRLSTIAKLDRIVVLDNGQIIEDGTHKQLIDKNGIYAKLWKHQSGGFLEDNQAEED